MKSYFSKSIVMLGAFLLLWTPRIQAQLPDNMFLLCPVEKLPAAEGYFSVIPSMGLFQIDGALAYSLDEIRCPEYDKFLFSEQLGYESIVASGSQLLVKNDSIIYQITDDSVRIVSKFESPDFALFAGDDSIVAIVHYKDSIFSLYEYNIKNGQLNHQVSLPEFIVQPLRIGDAWIILTDHRIYACDKTQCTSFFAIGDMLVGAHVYGGSLFFATNKGLYVLGPDDMPYLIADCNINQLLGDASTLYIVLDTNDILTYEIPY